MGTFFLLVGFFITFGGLATPFVLVIHRSYMETLEQTKRLQGKGYYDEKVLPPDEIPTSEIPPSIHPEVLEAEEGKAQWRR